MRHLWIVTGLVLLATAGCERKPRLIDPALEPRLQALATAACVCGRAAKTKAAKKACWRDYRRLEAGAADATWATACAPVSAGGDSFNSDTPQAFSVITGYSSPVGELCTQAEARAVEAADMKAYEAKMTPAETDAAVREALRQAQQGREVASTGGCAG